MRKSPNWAKTPTSEAIEALALLILTLVLPLVLTYLVIINTSFQTMSYTGKVLLGLALYSIFIFIEIRIMKELGG